MVLLKDLSFTLSYFKPASFTIRTPLEQSFKSQCKSGLWLVLLFLGVAMVTMIRLPEQEEKEIMRKVITHTRTTNLWPVAFYFSQNKGTVSLQTQLIWAQTRKLQVNPLTTVGLSLLTNSASCSKIIELKEKRKNTINNIENVCRDRWLFRGWPECNIKATSKAIKLVTFPNVIVISLK